MRLRPEDTFLTIALSVIGVAAVAGYIAIIAPTYDKEDLIPTPEEFALTVKASAAETEAPVDTLYSIPETEKTAPEPEPPAPPAETEPRAETETAPETEPSDPDETTLEEWFDLIEARASTPRERTMREIPEPGAEGETEAVQKIEQPKETVYQRLEEIGAVIVYSAESNKLHTTPKCRSIKNILEDNLSFTYDPYPLFDQGYDWCGQPECKKNLKWLKEKLSAEGIYDEYLTLELDEEEPAVRGGIDPEQWPTLAALNLSSSTMLGVYNTYEEAWRNSPVDPIDAEAQREYEDQVTAEICAAYDLTPDQASMVYGYVIQHYAEVASDWTYIIPEYSVSHGTLLSVSTNGSTAVVKAKIEPVYDLLTMKMSNKLTVSQNYFNVADLIREQGLHFYNEVQYWAVADMESGNEEKVISFTVPKSVIDGIHENDSYAVNQLGDCVDDLYIHPSLQE